MTIFQTDKKESFKSTLRRILFNFFPAYRRTGGRICFLSDDWTEVHVRLQLNWTTKNYVGSVFGGSIYGALDPIFMVQLIKILGHDYLVWDKTAVIRFKKPIKNVVYARFIISEDLVAEIVEKVAIDRKLNIDLRVSFQDAEGVIYAEVIKTLYIAGRGIQKK